MTQAADPVVVVGAGLAGLACARELRRRDVDVVVLEAGDGVGGRVRSDRVEGFTLDRGFQVLLAGYPECRRQLDYGALDLQPFYMGARVWRDGRMRVVGDPRRHPVAAVRALQDGLASVADAPRLLKLLLAGRSAVADGLDRGGDDRADDETTAELFAGFSPGLRDGFLAPFMRGITLDPELQVSARFTRFVLGAFLQGQVVVPAAGMGAMPEQLAMTLPPGTIRLHTQVQSVGDDGVTLTDGAHVAASAVVVATEGPAAATLVPGLPDPGSVSTTSLWWDAPASPAPGGALVLDGDATGPVNNVAVLSDVAPSYAPPGRSLVNASVPRVGPEDDLALDTAARDQLRGWFGPQVDGWRLLRVDRIAHAQPQQRPGTLDPPRRPVRRAERLWCCGDHRDSASLDGALVSGRRTGAEVASALAERAV